MDKPIYRNVTRGPKLKLGHTGATHLAKRNGRASAVVVHGSVIFSREAATYVPPPLNKKKQKKQVYAHTILTRSECEARTRGLPQLVSANTTAKHDQKVRIALDNR